MTDHDTAERAAYQRAVELAKDEIARLRADLAGRDQHIAQQSAALEAERAAQQIAEADNAALRRALDGTTRMLKERSDNNSRAWRWARAVAVANQQVLIDHPGAALLAELEAARAVIAVVRWAAENHYAPPPLREALATYDKTTKATNVQERARIFNKLLNEGKEASE